MVLRRDLDSLSSTGKSAMPEGLEKDLSPQDLADVMAHVRGAGPVAKPKVVRGQQARVVKAGADGALELTAGNAAIYGPTLVLEKQYGNLGYWSSADDRAVWTVEVPKAGRYEVWLDYACDNGTAGNAFVIESGRERLTGKVAGTGSWDKYKQAQVGTLALEAGEHSADDALRRQGERGVARPEGHPAGAVGGEMSRGAAVPGKAGAAGPALLSSGGTGH